MPHQLPTTETNLQGVRTRITEPYGEVVADEISYGLWGYHAQNAARLTVCVIVLPTTTLHVMRRPMSPGKMTGATVSSSGGPYAVANMDQAVSSGSHRRFRTARRLFRHIDAGLRLRLR